MFGQETVPGSDKLRDLAFMDLYIRVDHPGQARYRSAARDYTNNWTRVLPDIYKNEIPHTVEAALNFRLVKKQTTTKVLSAFDQWIQTTLPPYVEYEIIL